MKSKVGGGHYIRIPDTVFNSVAFRTLPGAASKLWLDLRTQFKGNNNGRLMLTRRVMAWRGWNSPAKLQRARDELLRRRLIIYTRKCWPNTFHKASLIAFTDLDIARHDELGITGAQAKHEYLEWVEDGVLRCTETEAERLPKRNRNCYRNGIAESKTATESVTPANGAEAAPTANLRPISEKRARLTETVHIHKSTRG